ncbi:putative copper homeostasis (lipo)protein LpqS [Nocardia sp. NPDC004582]
MGRGGGSGRFLWALLFAVLVLVAAVTDCAAGAGADHSPGLSPVPIAGVAAASGAPPGGESVHCDPHVEHAIRAESPADEHAAGLLADRAAPDPGLANQGIATAVHGVRGPPGGAVGGRILLTRLCIARR